MRIALWHGTGDFSKSEWPLRERMKSFKRLAQVPSLFGFPIVVGIVDRNAGREELLRDNPDLPPKNHQQSLSRDGVPSGHTES
jgi:hypothetical protein